MRSNESKLRIILKANALFSLLSGMTMIFIYPQLASYMAINDAKVLQYVGIGLVLFSATVFHSAMRKDLSKQQVKSIIFQDWAWVAGSLLVIALQVWGLSSAGYWLIGIVAVIVGDFALFQMRFLKKVSG